MTIKILKLLPFWISSCIACSNLNDCNIGELCVNKKCTSPCDTLKCGINADCINNGYTATCYCKVGFTGNPTVNCTKLDYDPCEPNPCGPNSVCKQGEYGYDSDRKIGAYCLCKEEFYGKPPNCRTGCETNEDCGSNEICDSLQNCVNYCTPNLCGPNSKCRNDNHTEPHCSCIDGYIPQSGIGCRLKTSKDKEIPFLEIIKQLQANCTKCEPCSNRCYNENEICVNGKCIKNPCLDYCYSTSNCNIYNGSLECFSTFDYKHNPYQHFVPEYTLQSLNPCETKATTPECGVAISEATLITLALG